MTGSTVYNSYEGTGHINLTNTQQSSSTSNRATGLTGTGSIYNAYYGNGTIEIDNTNGHIYTGYGIKGSENQSIYNAYEHSAIGEIIVKADTAYGMYGYDVTNANNGTATINITSPNATGMYGTNVYNSHSGNASIRIENSSIAYANSQGIAYGLKGSNNIYNAYNGTGNINIGSAVVFNMAYGTYATGENTISYNAYNTDSVGEIIVTAMDAAYGMYGAHLTNTANGGEGTIEVMSNNAYGMYGTTAYGGQGTSNIYIESASDSGVDGVGIYGTLSVGNSSGGTGKITITSDTTNSFTNMYGLKTVQKAYNAYNGGNGIISITNEASTSGNIYGIYASSRNLYQEVHNATTNGTATIEITNSGKMNSIYGIYNGDSSSSDATSSTITITDTGRSTTVTGIYNGGMYGTSANDTLTITANSSTIYGINIDNQYAAGDFSGKITINRNSSSTPGNTYGLYNSSPATIDSSIDMTIDAKSSAGENVWGITNANNLNSITITGTTASNIVGMSVNSGKSITNSGSITINNAYNAKGVEVTNASIRKNQASYKMHEALRIYSATCSNLENAQENLRTAQLGFREGVLTADDVLAAHTAWLKANSEVVDAIIDVRLCNVYLDKVIGRLGIDN